MKELFLYLIVKTFIGGDLYTQREIYVGPNIVYEEVSILNPGMFDATSDKYQIFYRNDATTYIDTIRKFVCVDSSFLKNKAKTSSHIWELKSNEFLHDQSIMTSIDTDSLLRCKRFNFLLKSNPDSQLSRRDVQMDVNVKTCRICTGDVLADSLLNSKLELVLEQELGDDIHSGLDEEFIFSVETTLKIERGDISRTNKSVRRTTEIELSSQSDHIENLAHKLINRENMQIVSKKVFFGGEFLQPKKD